MKIQTLNSLARAVVFSAFCIAGSRTNAQATAPLYDAPPTYPGFQLPHVSGSLRYSISASASDRFGSAGTGFGTYLSGNMGYISRSATHPFSMIYSSGFGIGNGSFGSNVFQSLSASQVLSLKRWTFLASDSISYLPSTPISGLSGFAGVGDLGSVPVQTGVPIGPQSAYATRISNSVTGSVQRSLTGRSSVTAAGTFNTIRFTGNNPGLELNSESGSGAFSHVFSRSTTGGVSYFLSRSVYPQNSLTSTSQGASLFVSHIWSPRLSSTFSVGPVFTTTLGTPTQTGVTYNASVAYTHGLNFFSLNASQSLSSGLGVTTEGSVRSVSGSLSRRLTRFSTVSLESEYSRTTIFPTVLAPQGFLSTVETGVQVSQSISRVLSAFASYNISHQTTALNTFSVNALQGSSQIVGFGLTYTPRQITLGRQ